MRRIIPVVLFLLLFFIICASAYALEPFISSPSNPLNVSSQYSNWNEVGVLQGQIVIENDSTYSMWYSSLGNGLRVAKSTSLDGLSWSGNTLYSFLGNQDTHDPYFLANNPNYLYFATTPSGSTTRIMRIAQVNGAFDNLTIREVLIPGKSWGINGTTSPVLWYEGNTYYLFYSALGATWDMGMATSQDGINFVECNGNPFLSGDTVPRSILKYNNEYYLFFHSPQGLAYVKTSTLACNAVWSTRNLIGLSGYFPSAVLVPSNLRLYYGSPAGGVWRLYLTTSSIPTPTPSPIPSPTPIIVPKNPIIIIPGLFGSWNKEAIIHDALVNQSDWKINPIVHEYDGLEKTLQNVGYEKNKDYFLFSYDWRKNIEGSSHDLNVFINNLHFSSPPDIVGHSLGGLVGRIFAQKYGSPNIHNLITVGSPHGGTAKVYKTVEGGEIETDNSIFWLSQQLVLQLYKDGIKTNKQIIAEKFPVAQNLLPINDYLKQNNVDISISTMKIKNNILPYSAVPISTLKFLVGEKGNTVSGYEVTKRTTLDELLDYYPDGRPTQLIYSLGDFTVTSPNAKMGSDFIVLPKDHRELIYSKEGIKVILDNLNIPHHESDIAVGKGTIVTPSLIFLMLSPAEMEVTSTTQSYMEQDGMIFIENALSGQYEIKAKGLSKGRYTIIVGQIGQQSDLWNKIEGEITQDIPENQIDTYQITFNSQSLQFPLTVSTDIFYEFILYLNDLNKTLNKSDITKAINNVTLGKQFVQNKGKLKSYLLLAHQQLFLAYKNANINEKSKIFYGIEKLENIFGVLLDGYNFGIAPSRLKQSIADAKKQIIPLQNYILLMKNRGSAVQKNALQLIEIEKRLSHAEDLLNQHKYSKAEIYIKSIQELMKEIRKI